MNAVRHHFVPQGFLRGFATDDDTTRSFVWVYEKVADRVPRKKSVRSIAWAPAYYAQEREDGTEDFDTLETGLAQTIDNKIPVVLKGIQPIPGRRVIVNEENRTALAFFLGLSLTRVPSFRDGINQMYSQVAQFGLSELATMDTNIARMIQEYGVKAEAKPWVSLRPMVELAQVIAESVLKKHWQFFVAPPEVPLVTSDNPVVFSGAAIGLSQLGPAHPAAELVTNLRKDLALVCIPKNSYPSMQVFSLSPSEARKFNRGIVRAARQRVFASHQSALLDQFVKKYAGQEQRIIV